MSGRRRFRPRSPRAKQSSRSGPRPRQAAGIPRNHISSSSRARRATSSTSAPARHRSKARRLGNRWSRASPPRRSRVARFPARISSPDENASRRRALVEAAAVSEREEDDRGGAHESCGGPAEYLGEPAVCVVAHGFSVARDDHQQRQERAGSNAVDDGDENEELDRVEAEEGERGAADGARENEAVERWRTAG